MTHPASATYLHRFSSKQVEQKLRGSANTGAAEKWPLKQTEMLFDNDRHYSHVWCCSALYSFVSTVQPTLDLPWTFCVENSRFMLLHMDNVCTTLKHFMPVSFSVTTFLHQLYVILWPCSFTETGRQTALLQHMFPCIAMAARPNKVFHN